MTDPASITYFICAGSWGTTMTTVREVNAALRLRGIEERLRRRRGYFCFVGGAAHTWPRTAIYTLSLGGLSVEEILGEWQNMLGRQLPQEARPSARRRRGAQGGAIRLGRRPAAFPPMVC